MFRQNLIDHSFGLKARVNLIKLQWKVWLNMGSRWRRGAYF